MSTNKNQSSNSNGGNEDKNCSATLIDLDALHCPLCCDPLTYSIFQCDEGHIVCSNCCNKLSNKCPSCSLPVGHIRCRAMERIMKSITVPCPNSKLGCTKSFSFGKELTHEKECSFSLCSCPAVNCNYKGLYKDLYSHFSRHQSKSRHQIMFGKTGYLYIAFPERVSYVVKVLKEETEGLLFVVQCFKEQIGAYVTMCVIAPNSVEVGEFSSTISTVLPNHKLKFELPKLKRVQEVISFQALENDFMVVPSYLFNAQTLKLKICVKKLNQKLFL